MTVPGERAGEKGIASLGQHKDTCRSIRDRYKVEICRAYIL